MLIVIINSDSLCALLKVDMLGRLLSRIKRKIEGYEPDKTRKRKLHFVTLWHYWHGSITFRLESMFENQEQSFFVIPLFARLKLVIFMVLKDSSPLTPGPFDDVNPDAGKLTPWPPTWSLTPLISDMFARPLKFMFSKKATKIDKIFTVNLTVCSNRQIDGEDFVNFCGLLRKYEF